MRALFNFSLLGVILAGCSSMSGYDAKSAFACKAPDGVLCESMTGIYANSQANNLPGQRVRHNGSDSQVSRAKADEAETGVLTRPIFSGTPVRSAPTVLRVWFSPWEDTDGDLHDQSYVYLPVDNGKWLIEHNRRRILDGYRPVRAPTTRAAVAGPQLNNIKLTAPAAPVNDEPPAAPQQAAMDMPGGILTPGMPGSPAQSGDAE
jgi:conjugal transfer pilus assembly protein TraV